MKTFLCNFLFAIFTLSSMIALICGILLICGYRPYILDSASMEPLFKKGDFVLAYTRVLPDDVRVGDVLIYRAESGALVMHRLIGENTFKGDANVTTEHVELNSTNLIGRVSYSLSSPVFSFLITHPWISTCLIVLILASACLPNHSILVLKHFA